MTSRNSSVTACSNSFLRQPENSSSNAVIKWFRVPVTSIPYSKENESLGDLLRQQRSIIMSKWANGSQKFKRFLKSIMAIVLCEWLECGLLFYTTQFSHPDHVVDDDDDDSKQSDLCNECTLIGKHTHGSCTCHFCAARHLVLGLSVVRFYISLGALFEQSERGSWWAITGWMAVPDMIWEFVKMLIKLWN